jgi:glucokinase
VIGTHGTAGEVGHLPAMAGGPRCTCGDRGHLEAIASGTAIALAGARAMQRNPGSPLATTVRAAGRPRPTAADVVAADALGDSAATAIVRRARRALGRCIVALANVFDPAVIALGGRVIATDPDPWLRACREELARSGLQAQQAGTRIEAAALGDDAALVGAVDYLALRIEAVTTSGR